MAKLIRPNVIETENFFQSGNLDTDYWTINTDTAAEQVYDNGSVSVYTHIPSGSGSDYTSEVTSKTDLRSLGTNFMFTAVAKVYSNVYDCTCYARLQIAGTNLIYLVLDNPTNDSINLVCSATFWCTLNGNTLTVNRTYLATGTEAASTTDSVSVIADSATIDVSSGAYINMYADISNEANSNARSQAEVKLFPIIFTSQKIGSDGTE